MRPVNNISGGQVGRSRLLDLLLRDGRQRLNNGTVAGGLAHALQQGMRGYQIGQERQAQQKAAADEVAAMNAMTRGMSAQQWQPPAGDTIYDGPTGAPMSREDAAARAAPAGGYAGGISALQGLGPDNAAAGRLTSQLLMNKMERDQSIADRDEQRAYDESIRTGERDFEREMFDLEQKAAAGKLTAQEESELRILREKAAIDKANPKPVGAPFKAAGPDGSPVLAQNYSDGSVKPVSGFSPAVPTPVPGRDVPFSPEVMAQKTEQARVQGEATASNRPLTADETKAGGFAVRMDNANAKVKQIINGPDGKPGTADDYDPAQYQDAYLRGVPFVGNSLQSDQGRQYFQAMRDWVTANLRKESGAVIGVDEMNEEIKKYFPEPGDDMETIQQKAESRRLAEAGMRTAAGRAYQQITADLGDESKNSGWSVKKVN